MQRRTFILIVGAVIFTLLVGGFVVYRTLFATKTINTTTGTSTATNPFGDSGNVPGQGTSSEDTTDSGTGSSGGSSTNNNGEANAFDIKKISDTPVSGIGFRYDRYLVSSTSTKPVYATSTSVLYVEQGTGHVSQYKPIDNTLKKISTTRVPGVYESFIAGNGTVAVVRRVSDESSQVQTIILNLPTTDSLDTETSGTFLPENIIGIAGKNNSLFYLVKTNTGSTGYLYDLSNKKSTDVLESSLSSWLPVWNSKLITLTTKPSSLASGYSYVLDTAKNTLKKAFGPKNGLGVLFNPQGDYALVTESTQAGSNTYLASGTSTEKIAGDITSIAPDKCAWLPNGRVALCAGFSAFNTVLPDDWYKGKVLTRDDLYMANTYFNTFDFFLSLDSKNLDMTNLSISNDGHYMVFINKKDYTPWIINLMDLVPDYTQQ